MLLTLRGKALFAGRWRSMWLLVSCTVFYVCSEATEETRLTLLIGGASLLAVALPASGLKRWNLERQAPLKRLKQCDCYMVTLAAPKPPVMTKLEFFFHGNVPVSLPDRAVSCFLCGWSGARQREHPYSKLAV